VAPNHNPPDPARPNPDMPRPQHLSTIRAASQTSPLTCSGLWWPNAGPGKQRAQEPETVAGFCPSLSSLNPPSEGIASVTKPSSAFRVMITLVTSRVGERQEAPTYTCRCRKSKVEPLALLSANEQGQADTVVTNGPFPSWGNLSQPNPTTTLQDVVPITPKVTTLAN
jgi:hypothetical protein